MMLQIPDEILQPAHLDEAELRIELAAALFQQDRLTLTQASRLAQLPQLEFQRLLAARDIPIHYGLEQLEADLKRVREIPLP